LRGWSTLLSMLLFAGACGGTALISGYSDTWKRKIVNGQRLKK
jgi:hypothetical protein